MVEFFLFFTFLLYSEVYLDSDRIKLLQIVGNVRAHPSLRVHIHLKDNKKEGNSIIFSD